MNIIEQFQVFLLGRDKSPKTIQGYGADLKQFQKWVGRSLETITSADVRVSGSSYFNWSEREHDQSSSCFAGFIWSVGRNQGRLVCGESRLAR